GDVDGAADLFGAFVGEFELLQVRGGEGRGGGRGGVAFVVFGEGEREGCHVGVIGRRGGGLLWGIENTKSRRTTKTGPQISQIYTDWVTEFTTEARRLRIFLPFSVSPCLCGFVAGIPTGAGKMPALLAFGEEAFDGFVDVFLGVDAVGD